MKTRVLCVGVSLLVATIVASLALIAQPPGSPEAAKLMKALAMKCDDAKQYSWEGELLVEGRKGNTPWQPFALSKVKLAIAPNGKSFLRVEPPQQDEYWLISNGQKSWAYFPGRKQYTEEESATLASDTDAGGDGESTPSDQPEQAHGVMETYARKVVPAIASVYKNALGMSPRENAELKIGKRKVSWPSVVISTKPDQHKTSDLVEFALDPDHTGLGRMVLVKIYETSPERFYVRTTVLFTSFSVGEDVPDTLFTFDPPKKSKLVEALPVPGFEGSVVLNRPAPDFELKSGTGEKVRLSDLRGKVVLLTSGQPGAGHAALSFLQLPSCTASSRLQALSSTA